MGGGERSPANECLLAATVALVFLVRNGDSFITSSSEGGRGRETETKKSDRYVCAVYM